MVQRKFNADFFIYILEFLSASLIFYLIYSSFPQYNMFCGMLYIAIVISPVREKSRALIYDRVKATFIGAFTGASIMLLVKPTVLTFCLGATITILLCNYLKAIDSARSALLSLISVVIPQAREPHYIVAVERVVAVTLGCSIALLVTIIFDYFLLRFSKQGKDI